MKQPNSYADHFRHASDDWSITASDEPVGVAAAWLQYRVARQVWALVAQGRMSVDGFAAELGQSPEAQRKKLSGSQPASLRDLVAWAMVIGSPAYDAFPREDSDFFPPGAWRMLRGWASGNGKLPHFSSAQAATWQIVVAGLANDLRNEDSCRRTHLLTSDWARQRAVAHLDAAGIPPQKLRLKPLSNDAVALQIGATDPLSALFEFVSRDEASDAQGAVDAARRIRDRVSTIAASGEQGIVVVIALGIGETVLAEALWPPSGSPNFVLGPFEPRQPGENAAWWSRHQVELARLAFEEAANIGVAQAIHVLKATTL